MNWLMNNFYWVVGFVGAWTTVNGLLHDIAILMQRRPFERELIHLLIDGHIIIFSGILYLLCFKPLQQGSSFALWICIADAVFMLGYCGLIFKLLPAIGMIFLNLVVLIIALIKAF